MQRVLPPRVFTVRLSIALAMLAAAGWASAPHGGWGQQDDELPSLAAVRNAIRQHFAKLPDFREGDIIAKSEVQPVFQQLKEMGWQVADQQAIMEQVLDDGDVLVATLRSGPGRRFMRKVSGYSAIYDRLDRVCRESGGQALLRSLVQLPDGERYAKARRPRAVPGLVELLPKKGSSKTRTVADYGKPTGRIYTSAQLLEQLEESHRRARGEDSATSRA
jgi:hypothetical protein